MASKIESTQGGAKTRQKNEATQMGQWDKAVEHSDLVDEDGRVTIKDEDGGQTRVAYNPYDHSCVNSMMNDQFKRALERDHLYTVEVALPESELAGDYKADKTKNSTGVFMWNAGEVGRKLPKEKRRLIALSRYMKNVRVVPWEEVSQDWIKTLSGEDIIVPFNCVPKVILNILADNGIKIGAPEAGMGKAYTDGLDGRQKDAKGWFDVATGNIVIVAPNNTDAEDVMRTMLHEGVAHYGPDRHHVGRDCPGWAFAVGALMNDLINK